MTRRRKSTRMFSREERRRERAAQMERAAKLTQEDLDRALLGETRRGPHELAEEWLGILDWQPETDHERQVMAAAAREFERLTGRRLDRETAEEAIEAEQERRAAERDARFVTTDAGWEEQILDAESAAQEVRDHDEEEE